MHIPGGMDIFSSAWLEVAKANDSMLDASAANLTTPTGRFILCIGRVLKKADAIGK